MLIPVVLPIWFALTASIATIAPVDAVANGPSTPHRQPRQDEVLPPGSTVLPEVGVEHGMGGSSCDGNIASDYWCASVATPEACLTDSDIRVLCANGCCGIEPGSSCDVVNNIASDYWCASVATPEACLTDSDIRAQCANNCCGIEPPGM